MGKVSLVQKSELIFSNKSLWLLIWPLLVEQLLQITLGMADVAMVSSIGEAAVGGVSLVDQINILLTQVFAALATGGAVVCSQYIGAKRKDMANESARQLLYTVTIFSLLLLVLGLVFYRQILSLVFGKIEADVMQSSRLYFLITLFALPGIALYSAAAALFRAQGNSRVSMAIALLVNVLNIGGNAIMIYGLKCGVEGVAIPTLVSRTAAAFVLLARLYRAKPSKENGSAAFLSIRGISRLHIEWSIVAKILKIGIPNGIENSAFQIGKILVLSLIATFGTGAIAANASANTLAALEVLPGAAAGLALLTVVGQCIGAGKKDQAVYYTKKIMLFTYAGFWALNIPFLLFSKQILGLYSMSQETTILAWYMTLAHGIFGMLIWPLSFTLPNSLRAAGDAAFTMVVSFVSMWTIRVGMSYVFKYTQIFGLVGFMNWPLSFCSLGVWFAMILDWVLRSFFFVVRFARGSWKNKRVV